MLVVNDIMTRHIDQVDSGHELGDVARLMARARISSVIVLDNEELAGIVTERDVLHAMRKGRASDTPVAAIMSTPVIAVPPELDCREAYQLAAAKGVRHLAVTDKDNVPVGIVTETDFRYHLQLMLVAGKNDVASAMDNPLWTLPPDAGLDEALELMENRRATCVVITEERRPLGIVTERDVVRLYSKDKQHARLADVMTTPVVTIPAGAPLHDAADLMLARRIRHIVVIDDKGMMVGLLTEHGLMRPLELGIAEEVFKERRRAEVELLDKDAQIATLIEALPDAIYFKDGDGRWQVVNSAGVALFGLADQSWQGKNEDELALLNPARAAVHLACKTSDERAWQIGGISHDAEVVEDAQGEAHHFDVTKVPLFWPDGRRKGLVIIGRDMTERKRADDKQRLAASVFEQAQEAILITDANSIIIEVNRSFTELTGYDREEAVGRKPSLLRSDRQGKDFYDRLWQTLAQEGQWRGEIWNRKKNGDEYAEVLTISCVRDGDGRIQHYVGISSDITQQKEHQKRLEQLAHYDALTQLPNRVLLADRMQLALAQAQRSGRLLAVGYLDLDDFKPINDT
ncbi:MAG: CBS domain-containing protein, partial [Rhodocyclaceae bacterium]|nr:CBS domain-containing protein [Rhodocyclaceae bacterium]